MDSQATALDLSALLLPVSGQLLVVPSVVVAEIIKRRPLEPPPDAPDWLLGHVKWHQESVPVLSFEALNRSGVAEEQTGSRIVIFACLGEAGTTRHYALLTRGVPNLLRLTAEVLEQIGGLNPGPAERMKISVYGKAAAIPDLDYIEHRLADLAATGG